MKLFVYTATCTESQKVLDLDTWPLSVSSVFVLHQAQWQPSLASTRDSASSRSTASMSAKRVTPASSLMSQPAGSTGDPHR